MEAMLCCWLQQLQEFGGPEVDKPDLLKGSVGSLKSLHPPPGQGKSPGSSGSLARNIIVDPKARYNVSRSGPPGVVICRFDVGREDDDDEKFFPY